MGRVSFEDALEKALLRGEVELDGIVEEEIIEVGVKNLSLSER